MNVTTFISQLRLRDVFKVATAYAITGWLLIEVVNNVFPAFNFPQWTSQFAILLVLLGFPIALVFAWVFELTPEGIVTHRLKYSLKSSIDPPLPRHLTDPGL